MAYQSTGRAGQVQSTGNDLADRINSTGGVEAKAHPEFEHPEYGLKFPDIGGMIKKAVQHHQEVSDKYDDMIQKARGEQNYYQNSPSDAWTKSKVAIKMGNR